MAATVRTRRLRWSMFWALVSYLVTTFGAALTNYLTSLEISPAQGSLLSTGVGLTVVMIGGLIDHAKDAGEPLPNAGPVQRPGQRQPRPTGRMSLAAALVLILLMCGGGGLAVTYAGHWVAQRVVAFAEDTSTPPWQKKAQQPTTERLAAPVTERSGILTLTVNSVGVGEDATIVSITAHNTGSEAVRLTGVQLTVPGSDTLQEDPPASTFTRGEVPAGGEFSGKVIFDGTPGPSVTNVTLAFTRIYSLDFSAPRNVSIDLELTPAAG